MMFWKFQTHTAPTAPAPPPPAPEPEPTLVAAAIVEVVPVPEPEPIAPVAVATPPAPEEPTHVFPPAPPIEAATEPLAEYIQAAERTMRFLGEMLQLPTWALFKNANGTLTAVTGMGDYLRYINQHELTIGRLSDLPTINLLGAAPPANVYAGVDRRQGNIDPATIAPYGVPLLDADGNVFGILCAFGERVASERAAQLRPLLDYSVAMLGALVRIELTLEEATRRTERAQADALVDPLTGLHNRRAWDQLLATEDQRCNRHGYDAVIFVIDLDGLKAVNDRFGHEKGDELIKNAAQALERCVRRTDVVARVGGDEFSILAVKCDAGAAARIREHIESTLQRANAPATVGFAVRSEAGDLFEAWRQADGAMYHRKRGNSRQGHRASDEQEAEPTQTPVSSEPEAPGAPEASVVSQILENVLPALVSGIQKQAVVPEPIPERAPVPEPTPAPEPTPVPEPTPEPIPEPAPAPSPAPNAASEPNEDLIDIVSRLSRLSDSDRRLLDVFFKGSR